MVHGLLFVLVCIVPVFLVLLAEFVLVGGVCVCVWVCVFVCKSPVCAHRFCACLCVSTAAFKLKLK